MASNMVNVQIDNLKIYCNCLAFMMKTIKIRLSELNTYDAKQIKSSIINRFKYFLNSLFLLNMLLEQCSFCIRFRKGFLFCIRFCICFCIRC